MCVFICIISNVYIYILIIHPYESICLIMLAFPVLSCISLEYASAKWLHAHHGQYIFPALPKDRR